MLVSTLAFVSKHAVCRHLSSESLYLLVLAVGFRATTISSDLLKHSCGSRLLN